MKKPRGLALFRRIAPGERGAATVEWLALSAAIAAILASVYVALPATGIAGAISQLLLEKAVSGGYDVGQVPEGDFTAGDPALGGAPTAVQWLGEQIASTRMEMRDTQGGDLQLGQPPEANSSASLRSKSEMGIDYFEPSYALKGSEADQKILLAACETLEVTEHGRDVSNYVREEQVKIVFGDGRGNIAYYHPNSNTIVIDESYRNSSSAFLASVIAHEGTHAQPHQRSIWARIKYRYYPFDAEYEAFKKQAEVIKEFKNEGLVLDPEMRDDDRKMQRVHDLIFDADGTYIDPRRVKKDLREDFPYKGEFDLFRP